ncbi:MAG: hypothetical protein JXA57_20755 [Armatimonadetes bacterium]|nr:hypothetical protein [Armatimonadota bacterium]
MKTTKELLDESVERGKARFAERKEIESRSLSVRLETQQANEDAGQHAMSVVTSEALSTAERAVHKIDQAFDTLEHLRIELIQIAIGERWHQVERPPQVDDLARELGELTALLQVREVLARKEEAR